MLTLENGALVIWGLIVLGLQQHIGFLIQFSSWFREDNKMIRLISKFPYLQWDWTILFHSTADSLGHVFCFALLPCCSGLWNSICLKHLLIYCSVEFPNLYSSKSSQLVRLLLSEASCIQSHSTWIYPKFCLICLVFSLLCYIRIVAINKLTVSASLDWRILDVLVFKTDHFQWSCHANIFQIKDHFFTCLA